MPEQARLLVGMGLPQPGGYRGGRCPRLPMLLSQARGDPLVPVFPRSPRGMFSRGLPDPCAAILSEHLRQSYILLAR